MVSVLLKGRDEPSNKAEPRGDDSGIVSVPSESGDLHSLISSI